jgi:hypothetical protein
VSSRNPAPARSKGRRAQAVLLLCAAVLVVSARAAAAQSNTATQVLQLSVRPVMEIAVSGSPGPLVIDDAVPGQPVASVTDARTTYGLLANRTTRITASLDAALPEGTHLWVGLESTLGRSAGLVDLAAAGPALEVVRDIRQGREVGRRITYTFSADLARAGRFEGETRTVVFTILE